MHTVRQLSASTKWIPLHAGLCFRHSSFFGLEDDPNHFFGENIWTQTVPGWRKNVGPQWFKVGMVAIEKRQVSGGLAGTSKPRHGLFACPFCGKCFAALETCGICIQSNNFSSSMFCLGTALKIPLKNKHLKIIRVLAIAIEGQPLWRFQCPSSVTKPWSKDSTKTENWSQNVQIANLRPSLTAANNCNFFRQGRRWKSSRATQAKGGQLAASKRSHGVKIWFQQFQYRFYTKNPDSLTLPWTFG